MEVVTLLFLLGTAGYVHADCYPDDTAYTSIIQSVYHGVTSDGIQLSGTNQLSGTIDRQDLCTRLTSHHNSGTNNGMTQTNSEFLVNGAISEPECRDALTYTQGYNSIAGWQLWDGYHSGNWYNTTSGGEDDGAQWNAPSSEQGTTHLYAKQSVRFDSAWRVKNCLTKYQQPGVTCRYGWNQSGTGVSSDRQLEILVIVVFC